jgi:hypothetical protein
VKDVVIFGPKGVYPSPKMKTSCQKRGDCEVVGHLVGATFIARMFFGAFEVLQGDTFDFPGFPNLTAVDYVLKGGSMLGRLMEANRILV